MDLRAALRFPVFQLLPDTLHAPHTSTDIADPSDMQDMNKSFQYYDADKSGALSADEVHKALVYAGEHLSHPEAIPDSQLVGL